MSAYDITFVGHMCFDEITPYKGETKIAPEARYCAGLWWRAGLVKRQL